MKVLQDNKGNISSFRIVFIVVQFILVLTIFVVLFVFVKESYKEVPDYSGLSSIITALLGSGTLNFAFKALQKKFE